MSQQKFDLAERLVHDRRELEQLLLSDVANVLSTEQWFANQQLAEYYIEAFADFLEWQMRWQLVEATGKPFEEIAENVDKAFLVDLLGEEFLRPSYWRNKL